MGLDREGPAGKRAWLTGVEAGAGCSTKSGVHAEQWGRGGRAEVGEEGGEDESSSLEHVRAPCTRLEEQAAGQEGVQAIGAGQAAGEGLTRLTPSAGPGRLLPECCSRPHHRWTPATPPRPTAASVRPGAATQEVTHAQGCGRMSVPQSCSVCVGGGGSGESAARLPLRTLGLSILRST